MAVRASQCDPLCDCDEITSAAGETTAGRGAALTSATEATTVGQPKIPVAEKAAATGRGWRGDREATASASSMTISEAAAPARVGEASVTPTATPGVAAAEGRRRPQQCRGWREVAAASPAGRHYRWRNPSPPEPPPLDQQVLALCSDIEASFETAW